MTPQSAIYEEVNNTITLSRPGYLIFDLMPYEETAEGKRGNYKDRNTFIMTTKNIGDFMKIDDNIREDEEPVIMNYSSYNTDKGATGQNSAVNVLKIEK